MTTDIVLRRFDIERDLQLFHKVHSDSSSMYFYGMQEFERIEESRVLMTNYIDSESNQQSIHRVIADSITNEYIGEIGIFNLNSMHHRADAYCILLPEHRKKGVSDKASSLFYKEIFESMEINRIQAMVDSRNVNAIKSLHRLGFMYEGKLSQYEFYNDEYIDIEVFAFTRRRFYYIVPWISWHEYIIAGTSKTLIYEQRNHIYYLLSNEASLTWSKLSLNGFIVNIDISPLSALIEDGIIIYEGYKGPYADSEGQVEKFEKNPDAFYEEIKSEGYIFDAHWDITNRCNEKCIHCYNSNAHDGLRNTNINELSFDEAKNLVDNLVYLGVFRLVLSGGEVLLKDFFIPLCRYIREKNIQLIIYTNGMAFTEKLLNELVSLYPSIVCISVYGDSGKVHDKVTRVKGAYKKVLYALSYFKDHQIETCHKNTVLTINYHCWQETLLKGRQLSTMSMINCTIYPSMDNSKLSIYSLDESQLIEMAMSPSSPIYYKNDKRGACNIYKDPSDTPCYDTTNTIYINPSGEIGLCIAFPYVIASLRDNNIKDIKRNKNNSVFVENFEALKGVERLDNWRSLKISDLKNCGQFNYCEFCIDVCPGDAFLLTGDLLSAPENHCAIAKARYQAYLLNNDLLD